MVGIKNLGQELLPKFTWIPREMSHLLILLPNTLSFTTNWVRKSIFFPQKLALIFI